jgi:hypothetical protein
VLLSHQFTKIWLIIALIEGLPKKDVLLLRLMGESKDLPPYVDLIKKISQFPVLLSGQMMRRSSSEDVDIGANSRVSQQLISVLVSLKLLVRALASILMLHTTMKLKLAW